MKRIFRPSPAATDPSPEKLPVEPPEIVTLRAMSTDRALWRVANRDLEIGTVIDIGPPRVSREHISVGVPGRMI